MKILMIFVQLLIQGVNPPPNHGTISGRLRYRDGSPAANIRVMALSALESSSLSEIVTFAATDGAGNYRLENMPPGRYFITAGIVESPSYYPGVADRSRAIVLTVSADSELQGIDFSEVAAQKIRGH